MNYNIIIIGFGVIAVESLYSIISQYKKKEKLKIGIVEKNLKNIPGGVAYSKENSKFGFFNNPLRLSHPFFKNWINNKNNVKKIIYFIKKKPSYKLNDWLSSNLRDLKRKNFKEIYFPRLVYSLYLEDKIFEILKKLKKKKISISYFNGFVHKISYNQKYLILKSNKKFKSFKIYNHKNTLKFNKLKKIICDLKCKKIILGNGLLPPKKIVLNNQHLNKNYIWDFYAEGGTKNLISKIKNLNSKKKKVIVTFIGNKAGLLETMLYLKYLIFEKKYNIKINVISKSFETLNKAVLSGNGKPYKFKFFTKIQIKKIVKASKIFEMLKKEFEYALSNNYNKYDVWTNILNKKILNKSLQMLDAQEKKNYNLYIFPKIRNLTRFTYPDPILAKEYLENKKKIKSIKGRAKSINAIKNHFFINIGKKKSIKSHIVVNVSGPVSLDELDKESEMIKSIKLISNKFDKRGFIANKNFMVTNQIYMPGILSYNFNPSRQTIIKAITNNAQKTVKAILKS